MTTLSKPLLQILQHTLGRDDFGRHKTDRNHFASGKSDLDACNALVAMGFMTCGGQRPEIFGDLTFFYATDAGREAVTEQSPKPPKLTRSQRRYEEFLRQDCGSLNFREWLGIKNRRKVKGATR